MLYQLSHVRLSSGPSTAFLRLRFPATC
jgi:hypothetical protein